MEAGEGINEDNLEIGRYTDRQAMAVQQEIVHTSK
jgi:hypothetical protein